MFRRSNVVSYIIKPCIIFILILTPLEFAQFRYVISNNFNLLNSVSCIVNHIRESETGKFYIIELQIELKMILILLDVFQEKRCT